MSKDIYIVDRFEGDFVVIEFGETTFSLPKILIPPSIKEGDVIKINITIDEKETMNRKNKIEDLSKRLFK